MPERPARKGLVALGFVALILMLCQGCVYLRLSRAIAQLKEPEDYVRFEESAQGWVGTLNEPVVLLGDLYVLLSSSPKEIKPGIYEYTFSKTGTDDRLPWGVHLWTDTKGRISAFRLPKRLGDILGLDFIREGLKALGYSSTSITRKTLYMEVKHSLSREAIDELMGLPLRQENGQLFYRFSQPGGHLDVTVWADENVQRIELLSGALKIDATFTEPDPTDPQHPGRR